MAWTDDRVEKLKTMWTEGNSASQIAKELGCVTRNAVIGKVHRLGLSGRAKPSRPKPAKPATAAKPKLAPKPARTAAKAAAPKPKPAPKEQLPVSVEQPPLEAKPLKDGTYATILTITDHMCKFPIGDPKADEFRFCGRKTDPDEPYCTPHSMVAYQPSRRRNSSGKMISIGPAPTSRKRLR